MVFLTPLYQLTVSPSSFENLLCFICAWNTLKQDMYAFYLQLESYSTESILSPSFMTKQDLSFCLYGSRGDVL